MSISSIFFEFQSRSNRLAQASRINGSRISSNSPVRFNPGTSRVPSRRSRRCNSFNRAIDPVASPQTGNRQIQATTRFKNDFAALGKALSSGDLTGAQTAFSQLQSDLKAGFQSGASGGRPVRAPRPSSIGTRRALRTPTPTAARPTKRQLPAAPIPKADPRAAQSASTRKCA